MRCGAFPRRPAGAALGVFCGVSGAGNGAAPGSIDAESASTSAGRGLSRGVPSVPLGLAGPLVLMAHHPLVAAPDGRRTGAWESLLTRLSAAAERANAPPPHGALSVQVGAMCEAIAGDDGLKSDRPSNREAAVAAAFAAARLAPDTALEALLPPHPLTRGRASRVGTQRYQNLQLPGWQVIHGPGGRVQAGGTKGRQRSQEGSRQITNELRIGFRRRRRPRRCVSSTEPGVGGFEERSRGRRSRRQRRSRREARGWQGDGQSGARATSAVRGGSRRARQDSGYGQPPDVAPSTTASLMRGGTRRARLRGPRRRG